MGKKLITVISILVCLTTFSTAQSNQIKADSLTSLLNQSSDVQSRINLLLEISELYVQTNPDTVIVLSERAYNLAEEIFDIELMLQSAQQNGRGFLRSGSYDSSIEVYQEMLSLIEENDSNNLELYRGHALRGIGNINFIQFEQEIALDYYNEVVPIYLEFADSSSIAKLFDNMASAYLETDKLDLAEEYYQKSLSINVANGDIMGAAATHINLAILNQNLENHDVAIFHANKSLETARAEHALIMESYAVRILGTEYFNNNEFDKAIASYERSIEIADSLEIVYEQKDSYLNLSEIYLEMGNFKKAYETYVQHKAFNDTLNNQQSRIRLVELREEYGAEKKEQEILLLEKENEIKSARLLAISLSLTSVLIVVMFISFNYASRKKKEIELLEKNKIIADSKKKIAEEELANAQLREENLQKELTNYALHIVEKNDFLEEVKSEMSGIRSDVKNQEAVKQINRLGSKIYQNLMLNKDREEFEIQVEQACEGFFKALEQKYPSLTNQERRLAALLRLNLTSKEIAGILNISPKSVDQSRYRLRKKLELPKSVNLGVFLNQL